jgi:ribosomal protein S18 acetylase RimI-like enzyme
MTKRQELTVRKAALKDASEILKCLHEAFEPYRQAYTPEAFADTVLTPQTLERRFAAMSIFVAMSIEGQIIGTVGCHQVSELEGHIRGMAVRMAWHGIGVAQQLLEAAETELQSRGCQYVVLDTTEPLQRAIAFYLKNGFEATGNVNPFFGMPLYEYRKELTRR